ncbi:glycosyltransferase [Luteipulveratus halotolerans]|uniref:glycosyltransferase n=1 Tax=Luteipulveratus halotolerans TaxID=1631356 RepID=UPI0018D05E51|nr:glycosyltransferase [Luteipulveratus halotolerans]
MRVLHVTDSYVGAGVSRVLERLVELTPEVEHHLLWAGDSGLVDRARERYSTVTELPRGHGRRILATSRVTARLRPDVVHAHSSWGGLYARALAVRAPVVYQPHCYKFDDGRLAAPARLAFREAERALARRSAATIVLSPHEQRLARQLHRAAVTAVVPNSATVPTAEVTPTDVVPDRVVMVGRICSQKDPAFFSDVQRCLRARGSTLRMVWVGDGDDGGRAMLQAAGIEVTGWLDQDALVAQLSSGALYFHCARYEGFPVSVLDAAALGCPVVVRDIAAFEGTPLTRCATPESAADTLVDAAAHAATRARLRAQASALTTTMGSAAQRDAVMSLYTRLAGRPR